MVKPLHPIDEIATLIARADGAGVSLTHGNSLPWSAGEGGQASTPAEVVAAVTRALEEPLDYPPLAAGIVPGDRVAVALDSEVPCFASVVRGVVAVLCRSGVEPGDIAVVTTDAAAGQRCRDAWGDSAADVKFTVHDPANENELCLVGTTRRGEPLLVNRTIYDADVVLPIGCTRVYDRNAYEALFPRFSNAEAVNRYRTPAQHDPDKRRNGARSETDEAGWMIGVPMTVQVIPGPAESVAGIIAGEPQAVARRSQEMCRELWRIHSSCRVSLLVVVVTGGEESQTWANVGRALAGTAGLIAEGGAVAICSNLHESPGHSLGRLIGNPDLDSAARKILHDHDPDSWTAWQLALALRRGPVYLLSQLGNDVVEDLGLAPIDCVEDLVRLVGRHESYAVVCDSQHAVVTVDGDDDAV